MAGLTVQAHERQRKRPLARRHFSFYSPADGARHFLGYGAVRLLVCVAQAGGKVGSWTELQALSKLDAAQPMVARWGQQLRAAGLVISGKRTKDQGNARGYNYRPVVATTTGHLLGSLIGSGLWIDTECELRPGLVSWMTGQEHTPWAVAISRTGPELWEVSGPFAWAKGEPYRSAPAGDRFGIESELHGIGPVLAHVYSLLGANQ